MGLLVMEGRLWRTRPTQKREEGKRQEGGGEEACNQFGHEQSMNTANTGKTIGWGPSRGLTLNVYYHPLEVEVRSQSEGLHRILSTAKT